MKILFPFRCSPLLMVAPAGCSFVGSVSRSQRNRASVNTTEHPRCLAQGPICFGKSNFQEGVVTVRAERPNFPEDLPLEKLESGNNTPDYCGR